jgi:hypothetical protein
MARAAGARGAARGLIGMGLGDNLMATGLARGAKARSKKIAFGDGRRIIWDKHSALVFRDNPNIARPAERRASDLEWVPFYVGHRLYNKFSGDRWIWNYDFRPMPGEMFFSPDEIAFAGKLPKSFILIEPNVPRHKSVAANKTWPLRRYQDVANRLGAKGLRVKQFHYPEGERLVGVEGISAPTFRHALAALARARLYIGPEGGLHHAAAAVGIPGVVLFGGFIPPQVTGYETHINLTGGAEACGSFNPCEHCQRAMRAISVDEVEEAAFIALKTVA